jgi:integrase
MAAFDEWLECAGAPPARCFAGRFAADESASGGSRRRESQVSARSGSGGWRGPFHTTRDAAHLSLRERDAGADLATVQKMVGHESVTTTAGYDRRGDATRRKAADLVHVPFFPRQA